ncbi:MAG: hypothetical protein OXN18_07775 [Gemmatimonadota bacterium]|nr:hypothetical protein [Gemmatimonadota bacterium]
MRIEPCRVDGPGADHAAAELLRRGVAAPPRASLDVERFLSVPAPRLTGGASASEIIVAERAAHREGFTVL